MRQHENSRRRPNRMLHFAVALVGVFAVSVATAVESRGQVADAMQCFRISDPLRLKGIVDIDAPSLGLAPGCRISRAKRYCVPANRVVHQASSKDDPIRLLEVNGPNPGDRICYRVKCPDVVPTSLEVSDQFGTRTITRGKARSICVPAVAGPPPVRQRSALSRMCLVPESQEPSEFIRDCDDGGYDTTGVIYAKPDGTSPVLRIFAVYEPYAVPIGSVSSTVHVENPERTILVLSSYESQHWEVSAAAGAQIERVILTGYEASTATVPLGVPVENLTPYQLSGWVDEYDDWPIEWPSFDAELLMSVAQDLTGLCVTSFHGCYRGSDMAVPVVP